MKIILTQSSCVVKFSDMQGAYFLEIESDTGKALGEVILTQLEATELIEVMAETITKE